MTAVLLSRNSGFAEFKLRGHRGSGGFSDVYEAVGSNGKRVALKVLRVPGGTSDSNMERFERELRILQKIDNRRIARLVAAKLDADPPWIASEFIDGPNLREAFNERGQFGIREAVQFFSVVVKALSEIHAEGIAHRDITPNNILLGEFGPVIIDFGSAKENLSSDAGSILSVGTPEFSAPEVLKGEKVGLSSDVFSLAKVFNFLLGSKMETIDFEQSRDISRTQLVTILKCLSENPEQRPTSAELAIIFPVSDIGENLTSLGYKPVEIKKLPRRISVGVLVAAIGLTAAIVGSLALLLFKGEVSPLTVQMIESKAYDLDPTVVLVKNEIQAGWLLAGPAFAEEPLAYDNTSFFDQPNSPFALEGYKSNVVPRTKYLEIKVELLRYDIVQTLKDIDLMVAGDYWLKDNLVLAEKFENFVNEFQLDYAEGTCNVLKSDKFAVQPDESSPRIRILGMFDRCEWSNAEVHGYAIMDIYIRQRAIIFTTANSRVGVIDLQSILNGFEIADDSIIGDISSDYVAMFADRSDDLFALDTIETGTDGGKNMFARRAFRVKPGTSAEISGDDFSDLRPPNPFFNPVSVYFIHDFELDPEAKPGVGDMVYPFGQVIVSDRSENRTFFNFLEIDMILIAEATQTTWGSIDFNIRETQLNLGWKQIFRNSDFKASGTKTEPYSPDDGPKEFVFALPTANLTTGQQRAEIRSIDGLRFLVPANWTIASDSFSQAASALIIHANPYGFPLDSVLADTPRLEIYDADASELMFRKSPLVWFVNVYDDCESPPMFFEKLVGRMIIEWAVLMNCSIPVEFAFGNSDRIKAWQASPIVRFKISTNFDTTDYPVKVTIAVGEYVPELASDVAFWAEMIDSISNQSEIINNIGIKKCLRIYDDETCLSK